MPYGEIRHINLKEGMPYVEEARKRLRAAISRARIDRVDALIIIHGYGSSGVGGKIRTGIQQALRSMQSEGLIRAWVAGENWREDDPVSQWILERCSALDDDPDLDAGNKGMSVVLV